MISWLTRGAGTPVITPAGGADAEALAHIHAAGFERGWDGHEFERLLADRAVIHHVARLGGRGPALGFALSRLVLDEAEVLTIAVSPKHRGAGLGRMLLREHLGFIAGRGGKAIFLEVAEDNIAAMRLYQRFGFAEVGRRTGYYQRRGDAPVSAIVMRRALD